MSWLYGRRESVQRDSGLTERTVDDVTVLELRGVMTCGEEVLLRDTVTRLLQEGQRKIIFNLEHVPYLNSVNSGEIARSYMDIKRAGGLLVLCHPTMRLVDYFSITKLNTIYYIVPTVADAVVAFQSERHFEVTCPVCGPNGRATFSLPSVFSEHSCPSCDARFRLAIPLGMLADIRASVSTQLSYMALVTYEHNYVQASLEKPSVISLPRRLDLFAFEVVEKVWSLISTPRRIVFDICHLEEFSHVGITKLLELSAIQTDNNRSVLLNDRSWSTLTNALAKDHMIFDDRLLAVKALGDCGRAWPSIAVSIRRCDH